MRASDKKAEKILVPILEALLGIALRFMQAFAVMLLLYATHSMDHRVPDLGYLTCVGLLLLLNVVLTAVWPNTKETS